MFFISTQNRFVKGVDKSKNHCTGWADIVLLSFSFPGLLFYTVLMSNEALFVLSSLAMMASIYTGLGYLFLALCAYIDFGNFLVLFLFFCLVKLFLVCEKFSRSIAYLLVPPVFMALYAVRDPLFDILSSTFAHDRITHLYQTLYQSEGVYSHLLYKYPLPFRYANTFATGTFMSPSGIKSPVVHIFVLVASFTLILNYLRLQGALNANITNLSHKTRQMYVSARILRPYLAASLLTILLPILFLPTFSNAKYYIFTLPVFLAYFVIYWGFRKVFLSIIFLNISVFLWIIISYR
jgi:hypothetical protein